MKKLLLLFLLNTCAMYAYCQLTPSSNWTWMGGDSTAESPGNYNTLGGFSATNNPGGRLGAASVKDSKGNLWVFGGLDGGSGNQFNDSGTGNYFNDLWVYKSEISQWQWTSGSSSPNKPGVYGILGK